MLTTMTRFVIVTLTAEADLLVILKYRSEDLCLFIQQKTSSALIFLKN
jgi:hypothetical protein